VSINCKFNFAPIAGTDWSLGITAPKKYIFERLNGTLLYLGLLIFMAFSLFIIINMNNVFLQKSLTREQMFLNSAIDTANLIIIDLDTKGLIIGFNRYAEEKLSFYREEVIGNLLITDLIPKGFSAPIAEIKEYTAKKKKTSRLEFPLFGKTGETIHILWSINSNSADVVTLMGVDITERVAYEQKLLESNRALSRLYDELASSEEELRQLAYFDPLTGLQNRFSLLEQSTKFIATALAKGSKIALFYLDIDNFKLINDTYGHTMGDLLLIEIGSRLSSLLENNEIFRFGGDEFVALITDISDQKSLQSLTGKIMADFARPFNIQNLVFHISLSMGITFFPDNGQNIEDLLKNADTAMYQAKESGKNLCIFFFKYKTCDTVAIFPPYSLLYFIYSQILLLF
jgi:diguanylate cyclase (GGDEF)-like protein/PAS domain S-box-containing protein